jgi:AmiR/NasT family two-component response regulator
MIADLQADGVLSHDHAEQMELALRSSRTIGAAIGIIMASRDVGEDEAFAS